LSVSKSFSVVSVTRDANGVATVWLNRPENLNAFTQQ
jgi:enoyl-CoA hydratase/carnithine racemase